MPTYYDITLTTSIAHGSGILDKPCSVVFTYKVGSHSQTYSGSILAWRLSNVVCMQSAYMNIEAAWKDANGGTLTINTGGAPLRKGIKGFKKR